MIPPEVKERRINILLEKVKNSEISSIKQVVTQIISIINDPNSSAKDLKNVIEVDPPLSAKLLKLSNSALYGYPKTISEIQEAIVCIGFEAVKELALNQKVCELFAKDDFFHGYSRISLWKHSVAVALCSKLIFRREFRKHGENIYVAGLLHDIGIIILDQFLQDKFKEILQSARNERKNLDYMETRILGFNHCDIGQAIAREWDFPDELATAIGAHHYLENLNDEHNQIAMTIYIANYLCHEKFLGFVDAPYKNKFLLKKCLMKLNVKEKSLGFIIEEVVEEISKMEKAGFF